MIGSVDRFHPRADSRTPTRWWTGGARGSRTTAQGSLASLALTREDKSICEPMRHEFVYDFGRSQLPARARDLAFDLAFRKGFLRPPLLETVFLHRKLVGSFLLCAKIRARVDVNQLVRPLIGL